MIKQAALKYDIARLDNEFSNGFRGVKQIPENYALMFEWSGPMVMDRCHVPLNAAFLNDDNEIIDILKMLPEPDTYVPEQFYQSEKPYSKVLEVEDGWFDKNGWGVGDRLHIDADNITLVDSGRPRDIPLSVLSPPKPTLEPSMWDIGNAQPALKPHIKRELLTRLFDGLKRNGFDNPSKWITDVFIVGSATTNQFDDNSDIDVGFTVDRDKFVRTESRFSKLDRASVDQVIKRAIIDQINDKYLFDTKHPVNYYYNEPTEKDAFDSLYDLMQDAWEAGPNFTPLDFNPDVEFADEWADAQKLAESFDISIGKLRRNATDAADLMDRLQESGSGKGRLVKLILKHIASIERDMRDITKQHKDVWEARKLAFSRDPDELRKLWIRGKNFTPENIRYKLLEKWKYTKLLHELEKIWAGENSVKPKIFSIANLFKLSSRFFTKRAQVEDTSALVDKVVSAIISDNPEDLPAVLAIPGAQAIYDSINSGQPLVITDDYSDKDAATPLPTAVTMLSSDLINSIRLSLPPADYLDDTPAEDNDALFNVVSAYISPLLQLTTAKPRKKGGGKSSKRAKSNSGTDGAADAAARAAAELDKLAESAKEDARDAYVAAIHASINELFDWDAISVPDDAPKSSEIRKSEDYTRLRECLKILSEATVSIRDPNDSSKLISVPMLSQRFAQLAGVIADQSLAVWTPKIAYKVYESIGANSVWVEYLKTEAGIDFSKDVQAPTLTSDNAPIHLDAISAPRVITRFSYSDTGGAAMLTGVFTPQQERAAEKRGIFLEHISRQEGAEDKQGVSPEYQYYMLVRFRVDTPSKQAIQFLEFLKFITANGFDSSDEIQDAINDTAARLFDTQDPVIDQHGLPVDFSPTEVIDDSPVWFSALGSSRTQAKIAMSGATRPTIEVDKAPGLGDRYTPRPYQQAYQQYDLTHAPAVLNTDDAGLGKTLEIISALTLHADAFPCLVFAPPSLTEQWRNEIRDYFGGAIDVFLWQDDAVVTLRNDDSGVVAVLKPKSGKNEKDKTPLEVTLNSRVVVIVSAHAQAVRKRGEVISGLDALKFWKSVIVDEADLLKNTDQAAVGPLIIPIIKSKNVKYRRLMTATPITLTPKDAIAYIDALGFLDKFGGRENFMDNFCGTEGGAGRPSATNLPIFYAMARSMFAVHRPWSSVCDQIKGGKFVKETHNLYEMDFTSPKYADSYAKYRRLIDDNYDECLPIFQAEWDSLSEKDRSKHNDNFDSYVRTRLDTRGNWGPNKLREAVGIAKVPHIVKYIESSIPAQNATLTGQKVIYFAEHVRVIEELKRVLGESGTINQDILSIYGAVDPSERKSIIDDFEDKDKLFDHLVLSYRSAGVGLNIPSASVVVLVELPWTWSRIKQGFSRAIRASDKVSGVNVIWCVAKGTIDDRLLNTIEDRKSILEVSQRGTSSGIDYLPVIDPEEIANIYDISLSKEGMFKLSQHDDIEQAAVVANSMGASCTISGSLGDDEWTGSGFRINDSDVLTCAHNIVSSNRPPYDSNTQLSVRFSLGEELPAKPVFINYDLDLAILELPGLSAYNKAGEPLLLGDSDALDEGDEIYAVGSPEGIDKLVTAGIVSSDFRTVSELDAPVFFTDIELHPGSSGGPVCNTRGDVIGIARGTLSYAEDEDSGMWDNLNYVIPINVAKDWLSNKSIDFRQEAKIGIS